MFEGTKVQKRLYICDIFKTFFFKRKSHMGEIAKSSDITIRVGLDAERVPAKIEWSASDNNNGQLDECKAMVLALFDKDHRDTLRIDLWTKEMQTLEMDRFMYQILRSLSQTYFRATQNKELSEEMARFAQYFGEKTEIIPKEG